MLLPPEIGADGTRIRFRAHHRRQILSRSRLLLHTTIYSEESLNNGNRGYLLFPGSRRNCVEKAAYSIFWRGSKSANRTKITLFIRIIIRVCRKIAKFYEAICSGGWSECGTYGRCFNNSTTWKKLHLRVWERVD